jgi:hypothetical protein
MRRESILRLQPLPPRPRRLSAHEMSSVFGGCAALNQICSTVDSKCCDSLECVEVSAGNTTGRCDEVFSTLPAVG